MELRENIVYLLEHYNQMQAEIDTLAFELDNLSKITTVEMIESLTFTTPSGERIQTGGISDKTANIALNYQKRLTQLEKDALEEITSRLSALRKVVDRLDFYINKLPPLDAAILKEYYFENYSWRELQELKGISTKTLIRHRDEAINRLVELYEPLARMGLLTGF